MKKLIVCILALIVLAGCVQQPADEAAGGATAKRTTQRTEAADEGDGEQATYVLGSDIQNAIDEQLISGVKSIMPLNYRKMEYGDSFVFGVGVQNILNNEDEFLVTAYFDKAYDKMMNTLDADLATMNSWIKTKFEPFTLAQNEKQTVSIVMEVGNMKPGIKPQAGTYVFDVETLQKRGGYSINKEYVGKREISIKIE